MREIFTKTNNRYYSSILVTIIPYLFIFIIVCIYNFHINRIEPWSDDIGNALVLDRQSLWSFLSERYNSWSSRIWCDFLDVVLVRYPMLFQFLNALVLLCVYNSMVYLVDFKSFSQKIFLALLICVYPYSDMMSSGYVATCINYLWPLCFFLFFCCLYQKKQVQGRLKKVEYAILFLSAVLVSIVEQSVVFMGMCVAGHLVYSYYKNKCLSRFDMLLLLISLMGVCFIMFAPGNSTRIQVEMSKYFPNFTSFSIIDKLTLGIIRFNQVFLSRVNYLTILISIVMATICVVYKTTMLKKMLSLVQFLVVLLYVMARHYYPARSVIHLVENTYTVDYHSAIILSPLVLSLAFVSSFVYAMYVISTNRLNFVKEILVLSAAFATQMMMAWSPTIYASNNRPSLYLHFTFIYLICILWRLVFELSRRKYINGLVICIWLLLLLFTVMSVRGTVDMIIHYFG